MKICLLTSNPNPYDDRIYYKLARSLKKIAVVSIINPQVLYTPFTGRYPSFQY